MSTEGLIVALILGIISLGILGLPFWLNRREKLNGDALKIQRQRDSLLVAYERVLSVIRDLDEDYSAGKLAQPEYESNRARWANQGVSLLQTLEKLGGRTPVITEDVKLTPSPASEEGLDQDIERVIANYARKLASTGSSSGSSGR